MTCCLRREGSSEGSVDGVSFWEGCGAVVVDGAAGGEEPKISSRAFVDVAVSAVGRASISDGGVVVVAGECGAARELGEEVVGSGWVL